MIFRKLAYGHGENPVANHAKHPRAFPVLMESEPGLHDFDVTRFLHFFTRTGIHFA
jgi:hypothetical protein